MPALIYSQIPKRRSFSLVLSSALLTVWLTTAGLAAELPDLLLRWKKALQADCLSRRVEQATAELVLDAILRYEWGETRSGELSSALDHYHPPQTDVDLQLRSETAAALAGTGLASRKEEQSHLRETMENFLQKAVRETDVAGFDSALSFFNELRPSLAHRVEQDESWKPLQRLVEEGFSFLIALQDLQYGLLSQERTSQGRALRSLDKVRISVDACVPRSAYLRFLSTRQPPSPPSSAVADPALDRDYLAQTHAEAQSIHQSSQIAAFYAKLKPKIDAAPVLFASSYLAPEWSRLMRFDRDLRLHRVDMRFLKRTSLSRVTNEPPDSGAREDLRLALFAQGLPLFVGLPFAESDPIEPPKRLFPKLVARALAARNWDALLGLTDVLRHLRFEEVASPLDVIALESLASAQLYERAGQVDFSVAMNLLALSSGCQLLPASALGDTLATLRAQDPAAFTRGESMLITAGPERRKSDTNRLPAP